MDTDVVNRFIESPLGVIEITIEKNGLRSLSFVESAEEEHLTAAEDRELLDTIEAQLNEYFSGTRKAFDLPLALEGTDFQKRVWEAVSRIPYGKTITYKDQAIELGDIKAIRAVASANGRNPIPIIIPCHRIVGSDGSLTGFRGGIDKKRYLLDMEAENMGHYQMKLNFDRS